MAYIGKEPIVGNFQKCDAITVVNGQAAYTLQVSSTNVVPESVNHMLVSLNGILQAPTTSFTVSGATLTFASNLATGDVIDFVILLGNVLDLGVPSDASITNAKLSGDLISGETDIGGAIADADLMLLDDGAGGTLRKSAMSRVKTYIGAADTPAFKVHASSNTSCANATNTVLALNTEVLDSDGCFNNTSGTVTLNGVSVPAYSFGPNVAGYYWVSALGYFSSGTDYDSNRIFIEKNTTTSFASINGRNLYYNGLFAGNVVHLNGSSDTIRVRVIQGSGGSLDFDSNVTIGGFSGFKLIGA